MKGTHISHILYGGDYNPDQWMDRPDILEQDMEYMKEAGINTATLGVFSWAALEPSEGDYRLGWLEEMVNRLYANGISTIMATPSGARPRWLAQAYPEALRMGENRVRQPFGGRHNHCYTSLAYREKVGQIDGVLAKRFASHPGVVMWHISNELNGQCHCPLCQEAFQRFLEKKYGDIGTLNERWCTAFWSQAYQSFGQVESPSPLVENPLPGLALDWNRFVAEQTADFAEWEIKALRDSGAKQPTTVNLMYDYQGLDYERLTRGVDLVSWDSYPLWHKGPDILPAMDHGMQHDYMRSLKHQPFLLMESCPSSTNWQGVSKLKRPGLLTAASFQAIAHGSDSVLYFQIRQNRGGSEKFHGAVIDHSGRNDTRVFQEVKKIGEALAKLGEIAGSQTMAQAAVIYDVENTWAMDGSQGPRNEGLDYHGTVMKAYRALRGLGLNVDVVSQKQDLGRYKLVAAPMLYMFQEGTEKKLADFVEQGGCLVVGHWSGVVDGFDRCFLGKTPFGLSQVLGLWRREIDSLYGGEENQLLPLEDGFIQRAFSCKNLCELVEVDGAKPFMAYGREFYQGMPCAARNQYGKGTAYYVGTDAQQGFYDALYQWIAKEQGLVSLAGGRVPGGMEVSSRYRGDVEYVFVQNFMDQPGDIRCLELEGEVLYGESLQRLGAYGTVVVKRSRKCR